MQGKNLIILLSPSPPTTSTLVIQCTHNKPLRFASTKQSVTATFPFRPPAFSPYMRDSSTSCPGITPHAHAHSGERGGGTTSPPDPDQTRPENHRTHPPTYPPTHPDPWLITVQSPTLSLTLLFLGSDRPRMSLLLLLASRLSGSGQ